MPEPLEEELLDSTLRAAYRPEPREPGPGAGPRRIGRYQLLREIARSGAAVVFRAYDPSLGREVEVHALSDLPAPEPDRVRRFLEEARTAGGLQHPGVLPVHDLSLPSARQPFYVTRVAQGETLSEVLSARVSASHDRHRLLVIFEQVCQTIAYAHARGVVHGNLSAHAILAGAFGEVQVVGWGGPGDPAPEPGCDDRVLGTILSEILRRTSGEAGGGPGDVELQGLANGCLAEDGPWEAAEVARRIGAHLASVDERRRRSELEAAAARARGREERRVRRLTLAVAAAVLSVGALGIGGAMWLQADRAARARRAEAAVGVLLQEAAALEGEARASPPDDGAGWAAAVSVARRADALARSDPGAERQRPRVREVLARLEQEEARARASSLQARADRRMLEVLESIHAHGEAWEPGLSEEMYACAFREYGIDVRALPLERAAQLLKASDLRVRLAAALDAWAQARSKGRASPPDVRHLHRLAVTADPDPWRTALREAEHESGTLPSLTEGMRLEDLPPESLSLYAESLGQRGDAKAAVSVYRIAQGRHPASYRLHHRAFHWLNALDPPAHVEALRWATVTVALSPTAHAWWDVGFESRELGRIDEAILAFRRATELDADHHWSWTDLGLLLLNAKRDPRGAIDALRQAVRSRPEASESHRALGMALAEVGEAQKSLEAFEEAVRRGPNSARAHHSLGLGLEGARRFDEARRAYEKAIALAPEHDAAHTELANLLRYRLNDPSEALVHYEVAARVNPKNAKARCNLGIVLYGGGDSERALIELREAVRLDPRLPQARNTLSSVLRDLGDVDGAEEQVEQAILLKGGYALAHYNLGALLSRERWEHGRAVTSFGHALRLSRDLIEAHISLAETLRLSKQASKAESVLRNLLPRSSKNQDVQLQLGLALQELGRFEDAREAFRRAQRIAPDDRISKDRITQAQRMIALAEELPSFLAGQSPNRDQGDLILLARICTIRGEHEAAARFWESALQAGLPPIEDSDRDPVVEAASAALRASGDGRRKTLEWLKGGLAQLEGELEDKEKDVRPRTCRVLERWKRDQGLAGIRDEALLAELAEAERKECRAFWTGVDDLLQRLRRALRRPTHRPK